MLRNGSEPKFVDTGNSRCFQWSNSTLRQPELIDVFEKHQHSVHSPENPDQFICTQLNGTTPQSLIHFIYCIYLLKSYPRYKIFCPLTCVVSEHIASNRVFVDIFCHSVQCNAIDIASLECLSVCLSVCRSVCLYVCITVNIPLVHDNDHSFSLTFQM